MKRNLVVLINPGHDDEVPEEVARSFGARSRDIPREDPPISLLNLGAYIRDAGYNVRILDTHVERQYKQVLKDLIGQEPLVIGLSVILGKFTKNAMTLTKFIKEINRDIKVVWGGKLVHLAMEKIFQETDVDFLVIGEGEITFLNLLEALRNGKDISGIAGIGFRKKNDYIINDNPMVIENLDDIYCSRDFGWDLIKDKVNFCQIPYFVNLYTSRGCRFNCSFCYLKDIKQMKLRFQYRRRTAENVIREVGYLNKNFGINVFTFGDDDFLYDLKNVAPVLEYMRKNKLYIEFFWTNIYNLTEESVNLLRGICQTVCYSIETTSPRLQKILNKIIPKDRVFKVNAMLRRAGINTVHNFLFGMPTETDEETRQNIDLLKGLKKINPYVRANCYILSPIPKTPIFEYGYRIAKKEVSWNLSDLANFHFRYMGESTSKFRPYLTEEDNHFYEEATVLTNELFAEVNQLPTPQQINRIQSSKRLKYIFGDLNEIVYPEKKKKKYILNEVIAAKETGMPLPSIEPF